MPNGPPPTETPTEPGCIYMDYMDFDAAPGLRVQIRAGQQTILSTFLGPLTAEEIARLKAETQWKLDALNALTPEPTRAETLAAEAKVRGEQPAKAKAKANKQ